MGIASQSNNFGVHPAHVPQMNIEATHPSSLPYLAPLQLVTSTVHQRMIGASTRVRTSARSVQRAWMTRSAWVMGNGSHCAPYTVHSNQDGSARIVASSASLWCKDRGGSWHVVAYGSCGVKDNDHDRKALR